MVTLEAILERNSMNRAYKQGKANKGGSGVDGMTVDDARAAVAEFLKNARKQEIFCVRIIHGKGNGTPGRIGVLREVVRRWLKQRDEVVAFCEPREIDGGAGATIVRLRALPRRSDSEAADAAAREVGKAN